MSMKPELARHATPERREFLRPAASAAGLALAGCAGAEGIHGDRPAARGAGHEEAEVTPGEDLMQEHGVLERILLLYEEAARRLEGREPLELTVITSAARIIGRFVDDYHEKLEEEFVFPRLQDTIAEVARLETSLGIADLERFTAP
jgi:hypothetical protein